jgi:hypothetical protein
MHASRQSAADAAAPAIRGRIAAVNGARIGRVAASLLMRMLLIVAMATMPLAHTPITSGEAGIAATDMSAHLLSGQSMAGQAGAMAQHGHDLQGQLGIGQTDADHSHAPCHACRARVALLPPPPTIAEPAYTHIASIVVYGQYRQSPPPRLVYKANLARGPPERV